MGSCHEPIVQDEQIPSKVCEKASLVAIRGQDICFLTQGKPLI